MKSLPKTDEARPVGVWIRVSTEDQAKGESPEHHERRARHYAEAKGWTVLEVYHLEGVSGKAVSEHPETKRMLADIRSGHISALIFSKLARLARNTKELLEFADMFRECESDLVSLQESIDTSTPAGRLFYTMIAAMAQWEREEITERIVASVPIRAKLGKPLGGSAQFGYEWKDRKLVIHPEEGPVRRLMYERFAELGRKKAVANELNRAGYRTRGGAKFSASTVGRLIQDPTPKGLHRTNYMKRGDDGSWVLKPESEWIYAEVEPLVSQELWNRCNALLGNSVNHIARPAKRTVHLFSGLVFCSCGEKMYVPRNSPKYTCGKCRAKILTDDLEGIFFEQLKSFLVSDTEVSAYLERAQTGIADKQALLNARNREAERVRQEVERTYRLYLDNAISSEAFGRFYRPIEERQKQLDEEISKLQADVDLLKVDSFSREQVMNDATYLQEAWPRLDQVEKRKIVECITNRIVIDKGDVEIDLCYLPSSKDMSKRDRSLRGSNPQPPP